MAASDDFYAFRTTFRVLFCPYVATTGTSATKVGTRSKSAQIALIKMVFFQGCMLALASFDPLSTVHMFTAREMKTFQDQLNYLNNTHYNLNWALFYTEADLLADGIWYDGGVWYDLQNGGIWYDAP
jgi:hypothetical protein